MAIAVEMPKMSDTMEEGVLVEWLTEEGKKVSAGDVIAQVETDKATMDLEVYDDGVLLKQVVAAGDSIPIGALIAVLGEEGEDISAILAKYATSGDGAAAQAAPSPAPVPQAAVEIPVKQHVPPTPAPVPVAAPSTGRTKASPLARRMASEAGVDLASVSGSGTEGRIVKRDIEALLATPSTGRAAAMPQPVAKLDPVSRISQMRKAISRRLSESKFTSPHFYLNVDVSMEAAIAFRSAGNEAAEAMGKSRISYNDIVIKACAKALELHPMVNSTYDEAAGVIHHHSDINVAVAVAVDEGLLTPVVRNANVKSLTEISAEVRDMATRARDKSLQPHEWEGSTFSTSNLGMFGIESFTAIINPPNACILAIGAIRDVPVVRDGAVVPGKQMYITLSCDHRIVDGALGAQFLDQVKKYIEQPMTMFV